MSAPADTQTTIPSQVIVMQSHSWCEKHPDEAFWLRLVGNDGVKSQPLKGQQTLAGARTLAAALGFAPTHWVDGAGTLAMLP